MTYNLRQDFRKGLVPNLITFTGLLMLPGIILNYLFERPTYAIAYFVVAWFCDWFDGWYARRNNARSAFGDFFDPLADEIFTWSLIFAFAAKIPIMAATLIIGFGFFATLGRIVILRAGKELQVPTNVMANLSGKIKTNLEKSGLISILLAEVSYLYLPDSFLPQMFEWFTTIGLWGSIPLSIISFSTLVRKLIVLWRLSNAYS